MMVPEANGFPTPTLSNIKKMTEIYCNENKRLETFENWPLAFIDKKILAKTGFFFTGVDDRVKCYFCEVEIGRWESTDNPISEHQRWSPNCPLLRRRTTNNVPIDADSLNRILPPVRQNSYDDGSMSSMSPIGSPINNLPNTPNPVNLGTQPAFMYPDHPEYATKAVRLSSFTDWPRSMKQKPEQLSEAGFFYTGIGDRVKCFSCGGGLKDWEEIDDPWEQHALWLDKCQYLKLMKGVNYIQAIAEKFKTAEEESKDIASTEVNNNDFNINQALMTLMIIHCICAVLSSTSSCSDEENLDNLSTNSQSNEEAERIKLYSHRLHVSKDFEESKKSIAIYEAKLCKICYVAEYETAFLNCGHVVACVKCASSIEKCPICRNLSKAVRLYFA